MVNKDDLFSFGFYVAPTPIGIILAFSPIGKWLSVNTPGFPVNLWGFILTVMILCLPFWLLYLLKDGL